VIEIGVLKEDLGIQVSVFVLQKKKKYFRVFALPFDVNIKAVPEGLQFLRTWL
jgi:hypothetical protein